MRFNLNHRDSNLWVRPMRPTQANSGTRADNAPHQGERRIHLLNVWGQAIQYLAMISVLFWLVPQAHAITESEATLKDRATFYDAIYSLSHEPLNHAPSPFVVRMLETLPPASEGAKALDIGSGNGRHAIYAAQQGYEVTAVDISEVGLEQTRMKAESKHLAVHTVQRDIRQFDFGVNTYDLILLIDFPFESHDLLSRIRHALKPGGVLLVKAVSTLQPHQADELIEYVFLDREKLKKEFTRFEVLHDTEGPTRTLWGVEKIMALYAVRKPE